MMIALEKGIGSQFCAFFRANFHGRQYSKNFHRDHEVSVDEAIIGELSDKMHVQPTKILILRCYGPASYGKVRLKKVREGRRVN